MPDFPSLTLVTGGAASGKSRFAEKLVTLSGYSKVYVATAEAYDVEIKEKIARHKDMRGNGWQTIEAPLDFTEALSRAAPDQIILLDCLTMWLSNHLMAENYIGVETDEGLTAISNCKCPVVVVSNEVGTSVVPENRLARRFRNVQGALNQRVAERADLVVTVISGLPIALKGKLPEELL